MSYGSFVQMFFLLLLLSVMSPGPIMRHLVEQEDELKSFVSIALGREKKKKKSAKKWIQWIFDLSRFDFKSPVK